MVGGELFSNQVHPIKFVMNLLRGYCRFFYTLPLSCPCCKNIASVYTPLTPTMLQSSERTCYIPSRPRLPPYNSTLYPIGA